MPSAPAFLVSTSCIACAIASGDIAAFARFVDEVGYAGSVDREHHLQIEGFEASSPWNTNSNDDVVNQECFKKFVDIVVTALTREPFSCRGKYWTFPPEDFVNPHVHTTYTNYDHGAAEDMRVSEIGIAPSPYQTPHPPLYGGFTHSLSSTNSWGHYGGKPIVLAEDMDFCEALWSTWREAAHRHNVSYGRGVEATWGNLIVCAETDAKARIQ